MEFTNEFGEDICLTWDEYTAAADKAVDAALKRMKEQINFIHEEAAAPPHWTEDLKPLVLAQGKITLFLVMTRGGVRYHLTTPLGYQSGGWKAEAMRLPAHTITHTIGYDPGAVLDALNSIDKYTTYLVGVMDGIYEFKLDTLNEKKEEVMQILERAK